MTVNLHNTMDASVWATEFCRIVGDKIPDILAHEDWVIGWFANAIMAGYDIGRRNLVADPAGLSIDDLMRLQEHVRIAIYDREREHA